MHEVNLSYFMIGTIMFLTVRLVNNLVDWKNPPSRRGWMATDLFFGAIFLMAGINGIMTYNVIKSLPIIFNLFNAFLLISRAFVEPNKNFFILISICAGVFFGLFYPFYNLFSIPPLVYDVSYSSFVAVGICLGISLVVGIILNIEFKNKWSDGQEAIWHGTNFWEIINNKILLIIVITLIAIETMFQLRSESILLKFFLI
ncbi:MAG: hypothetical protein ACFFDN_12155 [Candidatus Hodarchaeota archaeon]